MADAKALTDIATSYTTLAGGDLFGVERSGTVGKFSWTDFQAQDMTLSGTVAFSGSVSFDALSVTNDVDVSGSLDVAALIRHIGDTDTSIGFGTDTQDFQTGGSSRLDLSNSGVRLGGTGARVTDIETTITDSDTKLPTSGAVVDYVASNSPVFTPETASTATGGAEIDFTGLASGINEIVIHFDRVSLSSGSSLLIQLGTSSGVTTTGYDSRSNLGGSNADSTAGFVIYLESAGRNYMGALRLYHLGSNKWLSDHAGANSSGPVAGFGDVTLSGVLDRIRITATSGGTIDNNDGINVIHR